MNDDLTGLSPPFIPGRKKRSFSSSGCWNGALLVGVRRLERVEGGSASGWPPSLSAAGKKDGTRYR